MAQASPALVEEVRRLDPTSTTHRLAYVHIQYGVRRPAWFDVAGGLAYASPPRMTFDPTQCTPYTAETDKGVRARISLLEFLTAALHTRSTDVLLRTVVQVWGTMAPMRAPPSCDVMAPMRDDDARQLEDASADPTACAAANACWELLDVPAPVPMPAGASTDADAHVVSYAVSAPRPAAPIVTRVPQPRTAVDAAILARLGEVLAATPAMDDAAPLEVALPSGMPWIRPTTPDVAESWWAFRVLWQAAWRAAEPMKGVPAMMRDPTRRTVENVGVWHKMYEWGVRDDASSARRAFMAMVRTSTV